LSDRSKWLRIFLATKLGVFPDSKESLKLFSNYPSMKSNTRSSPQTQRVRERERELRMWSWSFGFSFSSATRAEAGELPLSSRGPGGGCVDLSQFPGPDN